MPERNIMIQTDHGQVFVHDDFDVEQNTPIHGFVRVTDKITKQIWWFNVNAIVFIGPAPKAL